MGDVHGRMRAILPVLENSCQAGTGAGPAEDTRCTDGQFSSRKSALQPLQTACPTFLHLLSLTGA